MNFIDRLTRWSEKNKNSSQEEKSKIAFREENMMTKNLTEIGKQHGVKYVLASFVDLFGVLRAKLVPVDQIGGMQEEGAGFAGFAAWLDMTPAHPDMFGRPDPDTFVQLPWKPDVGWVACDLYMDGKPVDASPRVMLKKQIDRAAQLGYRMKSGVECEFHLVSADGRQISDPMDIQEKPCYDQSALMRRYDVISEICDSMIKFGWAPYQNDHEDGNGQFEMNWDYDDCLKTADRHTFFKFMTKAIAEKHGLRATFMPKPFLELTGNGCHAHVSLWNTNGDTNLFNDTANEMGLSPLAYNFLGGIINSAEELCSIFNPTVNSYKRINAPPTRSGATWAPNTVTYGGNNRTHMIRIPDSGRFELRLMDGSTNPYLAQAAVLAAGLDGIENRRDPGRRLDIDMYAEGHTVTDAKRLPLNLLDAIRKTENSEVLRNAFGSDVLDSYIKLKMQQWNSCQHAISQWELDNTLDC